MRRIGFLLALLAITALNEGGCAQQDLPQRGFATRYFVRSIKPWLRKDGPSDEAVEGPAAIPSADQNIAGALAANPDQLAGEGDPKIKAAIRRKCVDVARDRGRDAGYQDFDDDTQKIVFDRTLTECLKWHSR